MFIYLFLFFMLLWNFLPLSYLLYSSGFDVFVAQLSLYEDR